MVRPTRLSDPFADLAADLPIAMLPIRIETRWFELDATDLELRIRIVPDEVHVASGGDGRVYVAGLPHHWLAIAKGPAGRWTGTSNPITAGLPAEPDPVDSRENGAYLGTSMRWITSFTEATAVGMGITVRVPRAHAMALDELVVFGVPDAAGSKDALGALFANHAASASGAALLPAGTATNVVSRDASPARAPIGATPTGDALRIVGALGLDPQIVAGILADGRDREAIARAMQIVLWPSTWGAYLADHAAPPAGSIATTRAFFIEHVRGQGPYPLVQLGAQPYGVLPATSLSHWPASAARGQLGALIASLEASWAHPNTTRIVDSSDVDRDLMAILSRQPASVGAWVRSVYDDRSARAILSEDQTKVMAILQQLHDAALARLGLAPTLVPFRMFADNVKRLGIPFVAATATPRDQPLPVDYLAAVAGASPSQLTNGSIAPTPPTLLYLLANDALQRVRYDAVPVRDRVPTRGAPARTVREILERDAHGAADATVKEHQAALHLLGKIPVGELERAFTATLDAAAYRVDAWRTAIATERLEALRAVQPRGCYTSGWAWLERPRPTRLGMVAPPAHYLHAPSLAQVKTAAVLRAGYEAHRVDDAAGASLEIELSSDRVRVARRFLEELREGYPLSRALGARFEEAYTGDPLSLREESARGGPVPAITDGWSLYQRWKDPATAPADPARKNALAVLDELLDAVADLLLADAVHNSVVGGSSARSAAALDALQRGEVATPDPRVDRTIVDGKSTQRRVVLVLDDGPGWPGPTRPRAAAIPRLEAFAARILGAPAGATISVVDGERSQVVSIADLDLCALDVVALAGSGDDRALLDRASGAVPTIEGVPRTLSPSPALDALVMKAASLARLFRAARSPLSGELGAVTVAVVEPPIDPVLLAGFPIPAAIGPLTTLPAVASATGELASWLSDLARVRGALEPLELLALVSPALLPLERRTSDIYDFVFAGRGGSALLIDAWPEAELVATQTTGVAFPFDAPRSQPPQAILLAVPPPGVAWSTALVESIIDETIAAARLRVAAPEEMRDQLAPALLVTEDAEQLTPSVDFSHLIVSVDWQARS